MAKNIEFYEGKPIFQYRNTISEMESMFGLSCTPINDKGVFLFCHPQFPNSKPKKIAVPFKDGDGKGFDVFDFEEDVEYVNIPGQYPTTIGPALIKDIETIYPIIDKAVSYSTLLHKTP